MYQRLAFRFLAVRPGGDRRNPLSAGQRDLQRHSGGEAGRRDTAQRIGHELPTVAVPLHQLEAGMVHVGHHGQRRNIGVAARHPGQYVPELVHVVLDAGIPSSIALTAAATPAS